MNEIMVLTCVVPLAIASALSLWRIMRGPSLLDRIIGFDLLSTCVIGMVAMVSIWWKTLMFIEMMMIFSLLGFLSTLTFVTYLNGYTTRKIRKARREKTG